MSGLVSDHIPWLYDHPPRQRFVGGAAVLGGLLGVFLGGRVMIWFGLFQPGVTPNGEILRYWPGFLVGISVGAFVCSIAARLIHRFVNPDE
jgi:hypothetical protein